MKSVVLVALLLVAAAHADVYMQYPRGSNNRLNEANRNRNQDDRLFDSQNNNRGGYNVGSTYYYQGTTVHMEWTNQHSCGNPNNKCEFIIQYMCDDLLRDGTTTNQIPETKTADTDPKFGRHESYDWYRQCKNRSRNRGLFTANQNLQGNSARFTRQNPNGDRNGFECPEERDYYPYWHPTPWKDIAVITNEPTRCDAYQAESQNVKDREYCQPPADYVSWLLSKNPGAEGFIPLNATQCRLLKSPYMTDPITNLTVTGQWTVQPAWGIPPPLCVHAQWTRDNHLGNVAGGYPMGINFTLPFDFAHERCTLRLRYNISTGEYIAWDPYSVQANDVNRTLNSVANPNNNNDPAWLPIWQKYGLQFSDVFQNFDRTNNRNDANGQNVKNSRGYVFKNNPRLDIFGPNLISRTQNGGSADANAGNPSMVRLEHAVNTNQFGRTFQDRSHRFAIRVRPSGIGNGEKIHNLQVKGRRGNIVQTYPAHEYDFWPTRLEVRKNDYVHFQWTGSNNNPDGAGQGQENTDRHNAVLLKNPLYNYDIQAASTYDLQQTGDWGNNYPAKIVDGAFAGLSAQDMKTLATTSPYAMGGNLQELDDAMPYFDLGPRRVTKNGVYHYVCTRNNNFSNRDQKAKLVVSSGSVCYGWVGTQGGHVDCQRGGASLLNAPAGAMALVVNMGVQDYDSSQTGSSFSGEAGSAYVLVTPTDLPLNPGFAVQLLIPYDHKPLIIPTAYRSDSLYGSWERVSATFHDDGVAELWITKGGYYVIQTEVNWGAIVGIILAIATVVTVIVIALYRKYRLGKSIDCRDDCSAWMASKTAAKNAKFGTGAAAATGATTAATVSSPRSPAKADSASPRPVATTPRAPPPRPPPSAASPDSAV